MSAWDEYVHWAAKVYAVPSFDAVEPVDAKRVRPKKNPDKPDKPERPDVVAVPQRPDGTWALRLYVKPYIRLIWLGSIFMALVRLSNSTLACPAELPAAAACFALGAKEAYVYLRGEFKLQAQRTQQAIDEAYKAGIADCAEPVGQFVNDNVMITNSVICFEDRKRAREMLDAQGLGDARRKKMKELSKGMAQTVQLLGTLVHEPRLIVLDEPFSGLDGELRAAVRTEVAASLRQSGAAILQVLHDRRQPAQ